MKSRVETNAKRHGATNVALGVETNAKQHEVTNLAPGPGNGEKQDAGMNISPDAGTHARQTAANDRPRTSVKLKLFAAGYCTHSEHLTLRGGERKEIRFPALFALIRHPRWGPIVFDTGYSSRFYAETARFPYSLYRRTTPVFYREEESALNQLKAEGVQPADIRHIIVSHFHADHIGGLRDFPQARLYYTREAIRSVRGKSGFAALLRGFLPGLMPEDHDRRSTIIDETARRVDLSDRLTPFEYGFDLFGDGSLIAIPLSGHAAGQIGIWLSDGEEEFLLCSDAAWSSQAIREGRRPHRLAGLIKSDWRQYVANLGKLHDLQRLRPELHILPTHCSEVWEKWVKR